MACASSVLSGKRRQLRPPGPRGSAARGLQTGAGAQQAHVITSWENKRIVISAAKKKKLDAECRSYVVGKGKRSGHEHLTGYRATDGKRLGVSTSAAANAVGIPHLMAKYARDKRGRLVIHHNHPRGTSLSIEDLFNLGRLPGTLEVHAHGHAKQWYLASSRRERHFEDLLLCADEAFHRCLLDVGLTTVPDFLHNHLFNLALCASGAIRYEHHLDEATKHSYTCLSSDVERFLRDSVVGAVNAERSRR